ncbi:MAG: PDZ domain-containing protein [Dehalococcoidia bacterium]
MRRSTVFPAVAVFLVVFAVAGAAFVATRVTGSATGGGGSAATKMAERWLRDDPTTGIEIYPGSLPPVLDQLLNQGVTNAADRMTLPVAPNARLVGSSHLKQPGGGDLVWLMYDVDGEVGTVAQAIAQQMDETPWQVLAQIAEQTERVVQFQNTRSADLSGTVVVRLYPNPATYRLTVARGGGETSMDVKLTALTPTIGAGTRADLTVTRVDPGPAQNAGLQTGDRIVRVGDTAVSNPSQLAAALQAVAHSGSPRASVMYVVQVRTPEDGSAPAGLAFAPPQPALSLPQDFPAQQAWQGLTLVRYAFGQQQGGKAYRASFVSKDAAAAVATRVRDGLKAAGWEITADQPQGFATQLQVQHAGQGLVGQISIDQFAEDPAYIEVLVQLQSGQAAGRP